METCGVDKPRGDCKSRSGPCTTSQLQRPGALRSTCTELGGLVGPWAGPALRRQGQEALPMSTGPGACIVLVFFPWEGICGESGMSWGMSGITSHVSSG